MATVITQFLPKAVAARKDLDIRPGDVVRVYVKIQEKGKTRNQIFEGLVLGCKHGAENGGSFTIRKMSNGIGVERVFPLYSPMIDKIEVIRRSRVRQAKLYYVRDKVARDIRRKMRNFVEFFSSSNDLQIPAEEMMEETIEEVPADVVMAESVADILTDTDTERGDTQESSTPEGKEAEPAA